MRWRRKRAFRPRATTPSPLRSPSRANPQRWRLDPTRIAVGGDSAGGQLAALAARAARDAGISLALQFLLCPVMDPLARAPSRLALAEGYLHQRSDDARLLARLRVDGLDARRSARGAARRGRFSRPAPCPRPRRRRRSAARRGRRLRAGAGGCGRCGKAHAARTGSSTISMAWGRHSRRRAALSPAPSPNWARRSPSEPRVCIRFAVIARRKPRSIRSRRQARSGGRSRYAGLLRFARNDGSLAKATIPRESVRTAPASSGR